MEQEGSKVAGSAFMSPMYQAGSSMVMLTNPDSMIGMLELTFRNKRLDKDGNEVECGKALMNDEGINDVLGLLQSVVNQVTVMSNLNDEEIERLMDFFYDTLIQMLLVNHTRYEIMSFTARTKVYTEACNTAYICMKRAFNEGDRRFWKGSVQEIHSKVDNGNKGGLLDRFFGKRGGVS